MQPTDRKEFARVLNGLAAIHRIELTKEMLALYWAALAHWPIDVFTAAAAHLLTQCAWMPKPYDFEQARRAFQPNAIEAWEQAYAACRHWRNPNALVHPRVARAAACVGGLRAIAMADIEKDLPHFARRFKEAYEQLSDSEETRASLTAHGVPRLGESSGGSGFAQIGVEL